MRQTTLTRICFLIFMVLTTTYATVNAQSETDELVVAWAAPDAVYVWRESNPTPQIAFNGVAVSVALSPDGDLLAITTGAGGLPENLWIIQDDEPTLVASPDELDGAVIGQVGWVGSNSLYFNTSQLQLPFGASPNNDLWRVDLETSELTQLREPGAGGAFTANTDGSQIALVSPGSFDQQGNPDIDGVVRLYDPQTDTDTIVMGFQAVATGSPQPHYPRIHWTPTGNAFYVAFPPSDTLYNPGETILWRIENTGESEQIGAVAASFFGLPTWNADRTQLFYAADSNTPGSVMLNLAQVDASAPQPLVESDGFVFRWAAQDDLFLWAANAESGYAIGKPDTPLLYPLDADLVRGTWTHDNRLVFTATTNDGLTLQVAQINDDVLEIVTIASLAPGTTAFSAVVSD
jgi:hypothetical protein